MVSQSSPKVANTLTIPSGYNTSKPADAASRPDIVHNPSETKEENQWQLAQLYRKLERVPDALHIENELRELLTYADPDVWLLRQLQALEEPAAVPSPSS